MIVKTVNVLLVEDMPVIAKVTEQMLRKALSTRYTWTHTLRLSQTLAALDQDNYDVVLLDLNLPDSRDLETVAKVIEHSPEIPIIVLTASNDDDLGIRAVQMGAQDFLLKGDFNHITLDRSIMFAIERHRLQRTIRQLAVLDELTGLYNRRGFNALSPDILQQVAQSNLRGYLCMMDLDRFKAINDELGHAAGDEALKEFAVNLQSTFRKDSLLVRLGGDEFLAMGVETNGGEAEQALQLLEIVLSVRNERDSSRLPLESSWGVTHFDRNSNLDITQLLAAADAALYRTKELRRAQRRALHPLHGGRP